MCVRARPRVYGTRNAPKSGGTCTRCQGHLHTLPGAPAAMPPRTHIPPWAPAAVGVLLVVLLVPAAVSKLRIGTHGLPAHSQLPMCPLSPPKTPSPSPACGAGGLGTTALGPCNGTIA